jgi:predicted phage-related endonuclease
MKYARHTDGKVIEADEATLSAYNELKSVRRELDALKERKAVLEDKIKFAFGDAEALTYGNATLATWKAGKDQERFDAKAFQTAHPDLYREFIKPVAASRRFLLK